MSSRTPRACSVDSPSARTLPTSISSTSASTRIRRTCELNPRPRRPARRATALRRRRWLNENKITGTFPRALCDVKYCFVDSGNSLVAPCGTTGCCDLEDGAAWDSAACPTPEELLARAELAEKELAEARSCRCDGKGGSIAIIIPVVIAAVILLAAILFLVRKRRVAARQPHRQSSMPTIGGDDEAEVEA